MAENQNPTVPKVPAEDAYFNFGLIPACIEHGSACTEPEFQGITYVDEELTDIDLECARPGGAPESASAEPWIPGTPAVEVCDTVGESGVAFDVLRWTRGDEEIEYWCARKGCDFFYAYQKGGWYMVVFCVTGHPGVQTPTTAWANTDGSTEPARLAYKTPDELIAAAAALARGFVREQIH